MDTDKVLAIILPVSVCLIVACFSSCTVQINKADNNAITEMVKNGADPISAKCAVKGEGSSESCVISAMKQSGG